MLLIVAASGRSETGSWKRSSSPRLGLSAASLALSAGWSGSCVEEPPDWQLHMCQCNYGLANWQRGTLGHCHYWHNPYTCRWNERWPSSRGGIEARACMQVCLKWELREMEERLQEEGQRLGDGSVPFLFYLFYLFIFLITWSLLHSALLLMQISKQPWLLLLCLSSFPFPFNTYSIEFSMIIAAHLLVNLCIYLFIFSKFWLTVSEEKGASVLILAWKLLICQK